MARGAGWREACKGGKVPAVGSGHLASHTSFLGDKGGNPLPGPSPRFGELLSLMMTSQVKFAFVYTHTHTIQPLSGIPLSALKQKVAVWHPILARQQVVNERSEFYS